MAVHRAHAVPSQSKAAKRRIVLIVDTWSNHVPVDVINVIRQYPTLLKLAVLSRQRESMAIND
jgi:hypothetical protein